jgi:hypothetical protein
MQTNFDDDKDHDLLLSASIRDDCLISSSGCRCWYNAFVCGHRHTVRLPSPSEFGKRHHFINQHDLASATGTPLRPYNSHITVIDFALNSPHSIILTLDTYRSISMSHRDWHRTM